MPKELAIVLSNGSLNSAVLAAIAQQQYRLIMIFCETAPNAGRPGQVFDQQVTHFKPYRTHRVPMHFLASLEKSDGRAQASDPRTGDNVGGRLLNLSPIVAVGLRYAAHYNAPIVYFGYRIGEHGPDLARGTEFTQVWNEMVQLTCERPGLSVVTPLLDLEPWQVVDLGVQVSAPLQFTWTCEHIAGEPCGSCRSCRARESAFIRSGKSDPSLSLGKV
jgi:hypothetical protein